MSSYEIGNHTKRFWVICYTLFITNAVDAKFLPKERFFETGFYSNEKVLCFSVHIFKLGITVIYRKKINA
jgi:hypothetical protein